MVSVAADISNVLGDIPDKARVVLEVMKGVAVDPKTGAAEIRGLAAQMAKVAAGGGTKRPGRGGDAA